ncbi:hypothetical protein HK096_000639, partial [Nowakowskiella sp. JEL0078]
MQPEFFFPQPVIKAKVDENPKRKREFEIEDDFQFDDIPDFPELFDFEPQIPVVFEKNPINLLPGNQVLTCENIHEIKRPRNSSYFSKNPNEIDKDIQSKSATPTKYPNIVRKFPGPAGELMPIDDINDIVNLEKQQGIQLIPRVLYQGNPKKIPRSNQFQPNTAWSN